MKIRISDIGPQGLAIKDELSLNAINQRMAEGSNNDIIFTGAPQVEIIVNQTPVGAETKGTVKTKYRQPCSWCLEEKERELEISADFIFQKQDSATSSNEINEEELFDDIGITYFSGDHIDLEELIQESIILSLTPFWRPPECADKSCSLCGKKTSEILPASDSSGKISMGELFKKAGVKH